MKAAYLEGSRSSSAHSFQALCYGCMVGLAFTPYPLAGLLFYGTALYCALLTKTSNTLWTSFWFGLGKFAIGIGWVFNSLHLYTDFSVGLASLLTLGLLSGLSLCDVFSAMLYHLLRHRPYPQPLLFSATMLLGEWCRATLLGGFPWLLNGYALADTPLLPFAAIFGALGLSLITYLVGGLLASAITQPRRQKSYFSYATIIVVTALPMLAGGCHWGMAVNPSLGVTLVQGDIDDRDKWQDPIQTLGRYQQLSHTKAEKNDLIIWPETTLSIPNQHLTPELQLYRQWLKKNKITLVLGEIGQNKKGHFTNRLVALGEDHGIYDKTHLLPFGEYNPLAAITQHVSWLEIPYIDLSPGAFNQPLLHLHHTQVAPFICIEIAFNDSGFRHRASKASWFITITDDRWFGYPWTQTQHLQIAQVRSAELYKPQVIVGNNGPTAFINQEGKVIASLHSARASVLHHQLMPYNSDTPFSELGNLPIIVFFLTLIGSQCLHKIIARHKHLPIITAATV